MSKYYQYAHHRGKPDPMETITWMMKAMIDQSNATAYTQERMMEQGIYFMIYQGKYQFLDKTWPKDLVVCASIQGVDRFFLHRKVEIMGVDGERLAIGEFPWFIYHRKAREMIPWQREWVEAYGILEPQKGELPSATRYRGQWETKAIYKVRAEHMDGNDHANNTHYIRWLLDSIPEDKMKTHELAQLSISYTRELVAGDEVIILGAWDYPYSYHEIRLGENRLCARAQGLWRGGHQENL